MANIQKQMTDVSASLESHAFDLSERHLFSAKAGMLLPIYNKQVVPGDYFEIDPVSFLRTQRVNTASYARMRQHVDFFFVPYQQLYHRFPEMKYQRMDPTIARKGNTHGRDLPIMSPWMSLQALYANVLRCTTANNDGTEVGTQVSYDKDEFGYFETCNRARLCDLLGYGSLRDYIRVYRDSENGDGVQIPAIPPSLYAAKHVTIWPWLAYQKIWADYYRNPWFDLDPDPWNFNLDDLACTTDGGANISFVRAAANEDDNYAPELAGIFKMRYRQWKRDYFTGLFPDKQFGDVAQILGTTNFSLGGSLTQGPQNLQIIGLNDSPYPNLQAGDVTIGGQSSADNMYPTKLTGGISALDVRRAELLQVWKEKTLRAGSRTNAQQVAHFGVSSHYIPKDHVQHLGGYSEVISINEVVSTSLDKTGLSDTDLDGLGELGGKATSLGRGDKIRFKAHDDGIIMAIFSILPESEYSAFGLSPEHTRIDPFDYFTPAFQNLGFQAVNRANLDVMHVGFASNERNMNQILGYAPPYYDMKIGIDKVHGEFIPSFSLATAANLPRPWANEDSTRGGSLQAFDCARRDATPLVGTLPFYYVNPNVVDSVFAVNADSFEDTDEFFVNFFLDIKAVRPMSVLGLPNF